MFRGYRYAIIAVVGWLVCSPLSYAQQQTSPALESQPVTPSQQGNDSAGKQDNAPEKQPETERLAPALNQIESAIRDIVPKKDEAGDQRQEDRDKADLQAQEDMAFWAKGMFWATFATVLVTLAGLALIGRTLHHTRRAADYAFDMVEEAKAATTAAREVVEVTRKIGEAQSRAYLTCTEAKFTISKDSIFCQLVIANKGQSPGDNIRIQPGIKAGEIEARKNLRKEVECEAISAGSTGNASFTGEFEELGDEFKAALYKNTEEFSIVCEISWTDVFDKRTAITVWLFPPLYYAPFTKKPMIKRKDRFELHFERIKGDRKEPEKHDAQE